MDKSQYMSLFLEESSDNIDNLNSSMLQLEKDPENIELINEIFRFAHTIKGMSATMGFTFIAELTHNMENVLDKLRNKELQASTEVISILFECVDILEKMVDAVSTGENVSMDTADIVNKLNNIVGKKPALSNSNVCMNNEVEYNRYDIDILEEAKNKGYCAYLINLVLRADCQMKSVRAFLIFKSLQEMGEIIKSNPCAESLEKEEFDQKIDLVFLSKSKKDIILKIIDDMVDIEHFMLNEIDVEKIKQQEAALQETVKDKIENTSISKPDMQVKKPGKWVRVDLDRLDKLMNLAGELVIYKAGLEQLSESYNKPELKETVEQMGRTMLDLQDHVMKMRMIPLESVFGRFPRMVRDLSTKLNKEIKFEIIGQDTELDRTVIDELGESLVHIIRNAVDHGIESKEERIAEGKDPVGSVTVTAYQEGNKAVIVVKDDGKGLDVEKIKSKALSKKINIDGMSDNDIRNLIFLEGFSTSDKVTEVSGRGVGMDIVRTNVTSIGGSIDVKSELGKGTSFVVYLPLTLSIIQALLVEVGSETFAIPIGFIEKIIDIKKEDIKYANSKEAILDDDQIIRIIRLDRKLNIEINSCESGYAIIANIGDRKVGIIVDSLIGQQEIVVKPLGQSLKALKEYSGATILGDGSVILILDIVSILLEG